MSINHLNSEGVVSTPYCSHCYTANRVRLARWRNSHQSEVWTEGSKVKIQCDINHITNHSIF